MSGASKGLGGSSRWPNRLESEGVQADQEAFHGTRGSSGRVLGLVCPRGKPEIYKRNYSKKDGGGGVLGEPAAGRRSACKTPLPSAEKAGAAEEERRGEADRWEGGEEEGEDA